MKILDRITKSKYYKTFANLSVVAVLIKMFYLALGYSGTQWGVNLFHKINCATGGLLIVLLCAGPLNSQVEFTVNAGMASTKTTIPAGALDGETDANGILEDIIVFAEETINSTGIINEERTISTFTPIISGKIRLDTESFWAPYAELGIGGKMKLIKNLIPRLRGEAGVELYPVRLTSLRSRGGFDLTKLVVFGLSVEHDNSYRKSLSNKTAVIATAGLQLSLGEAYISVGRDFDIGGQEGYLVNHNATEFKIGMTLDALRSIF